MSRLGQLSTRATILALLREGGMLERIADVIMAGAARVAKVSRLQCMRACVHACMRACVHACMRACVHVCVCAARVAKASPFLTTTCVHLAYSPA